MHIKIDSGLGRIGFIPGHTLEAVEDIVSLPGIDAEGAFTHFALADTGDMTYTREQYRRFLEALDQLSAKGIRFRMRHCCNSAATLETPEMALDAVRPGHIIVGMYPSPEVKRSIHRKTLLRVQDSHRPDPGTARRDGGQLRSGLCYWPARTHRPAPLVYADGYYRELWNKDVEVLVGGVRCPVEGRICMDQMMVKCNFRPPGLGG